MRRIHTFGAALIALVLSPGIAPAAAIQSTTIALSGQAVPGEEGVGGQAVYSTGFLGPKVNERGEVMFSASILNAPNSSSRLLVKVAPDGTQSVVHRQGEAATNGAILTPNAFKSTFALADNGIALSTFAGRDAANADRSGLYYDTGGGMAPLIAMGQDLGGGLSVASRGSLESRTSSNGRGVAAVSVAGPGVTAANSVALVRGAPGETPEILIRFGDEIVPGQFVRNLQPGGINAAGQVLFYAQTQGSGPFDLYLANADGSIERVVGRGDPAPDGGTFVGNVTAAAIGDSGKVVFGMDTSMNARGGLFSMDNGDLAFDGPGDVGKIEVNPDGSYAARGGDAVEGSTVFYNDGTSLSLAVPGIGATLPDAPGIDDPDVKLNFYENLVGIDRFGNQGVVTTLGPVGVTDGSDNLAIYMVTDGVMRLVARKGDLLEIAPGDMRRITDLAIDRTNDNGQQDQLIGNGVLAYIAYFEDGSSGVFAARSLAAPVPLPAGGALAVGGLAMLAALGRRSRRHKSVRLRQPL